MPRKAKRKRQQCCPGCGLPWKPTSGDPFLCIICRPVPSQGGFKAFHERRQAMGVNRPGLPPRTPENQAIVERVSRRVFAGPAEE